MKSSAQSAASTSASNPPKELTPHPSNQIKCYTSTQKTCSRLTDSPKKANQPQEVDLNHKEVASVADHKVDLAADHNKVDKEEASVPPEEAEVDSEEEDIDHQLITQRFVFYSK